MQTVVEIRLPRKSTQTTCMIFATNSTALLGYMVKGHHYHHDLDFIMHSNLLTLDTILLLQCLVTFITLITYLPIWTET